MPEEAADRGRRSVLASAGAGPDPSNALALDQLGSSTATFDAKGWYADGHAGSGEASTHQLTIVAQCLPL